jgi:tetratricopeptide (TPR) repeat protein
MGAVSSGRRLSVISMGVVSSGGRKLSEKKEEEEFVEETVDEQAEMDALANAALGITSLGDEDQPDKAADGPTAEMEKQVDEEALVLELLGEDADARKRATIALWEHWFSEQGAEARRRLEQAVELMSTPKTAERAAAELNAIISDYPAWAEPLNRLATLRFMERKFSESIDLCEKVLAMKPHHFACLSGLTMAYYNNREPEKARGAAELLTKVSPSMGLPLLAQLDREQLSAISQLADRPPEMVKALCAYIMKTTGAAAKTVPERLVEGGSLLARLCNMLTAMGLDEGDEGTKPLVEEYCTWLQTSYFDGVTAAEHGEPMRELSRRLNRHVTELAETQEFATKAQDLTEGLGAGVAS